MSLFRNLRDVCITFEEELRHDSSQLFTARIGQPFEDEITKKMQDLSFFTAKLRLVKAKLMSVAQPPPQDLSEKATLKNYSDTATWKVIEQQTVKAISQGRDVRTLITTPDSKLDPGLIERKNSIISKLNDFRAKEYHLRENDAMLKGAESDHYRLRAQWDKELGELRDLRQARDEADDEMELKGPLYNKLQNLVQKMEIMRWLVSRFVTARSSGYDWLSDPDRRLAALKRAREPNTIESYTGM